MSVLFSITVLPLNACFETPEDLPVLLAAQDADIRLPSSCRNGTCRTCMCRMTSGAVRYDIEWPGLSVDEKQDGYILPCVAYAVSDVVLEEPRAMRIPVAK